MRQSVLGLALAAALLGRERIETYAVVLTEPPVGRRLSKPLKTPVVRARAEEAEIVALAETVAETQRPIRAAIEQMGLPVTGSTRHVLNAVFVEATPEQARRLRSLAGVRGVVRMVRYKPLLNAAADLINAPAAWDALGGVSNAGAGIKIGIIDTGLDNTHPGLQDPSLPLPAGYPRATPQDLPFTSNKIIAARSYVKPSGKIDPARSRPDDYTPRDRSGHGTFVALIAAGRRIDSPAGGPLTGIAPKAFLGNYKTSGSTDINDGPRQDSVLMAMDDAVSDGMDVVNLSLGSIATYAPDDTGFACSSDPRAICDPLAEAVAVATENFGMVVVLAAGNDGDRGVNFPALNTISSPGTAHDAITVGATTSSRLLTSTLRGGSGASSSLQAAPALFGNGPRPDRPLTGRIRSVEDVGDDGTACKALPASSLAGVMALVRRGNCDFEDKVVNTQAAGATAVVVYNRTGQQDPITMTGLVNATIPAVMVGNTVGLDLRSYIRSNTSATVTLDPQLVSRSTTADRVAGFSARGPSIDMEVKPDVVAPGVSIFSATQKLDPNGAEFDPTGFTTLEGSSFSAALASGVAALVFQRFPNFDPFQVKSAVVTTATANVLDGGNPARETSVGAGKLNAAAAINPGALVDPANFSFGALTSATRFPISGTLALTNAGAASDTFRIDVQQRDPDSNARVTVNGGTSASVQLGSGQSARLTVALSGSLPRPGFYEGALVIRGTTANLRVVYHYAVATGQPANIIPIEGDGVVGTAGKPHPTLLIFKLVDTVGLPVPNANVQFQVTQGGGKIVEADAKTDIYGIAAADVDLGPDIGDQSYSATAGGLTFTFLDAARPEPVINNGGVVNGASFARGKTVAPGSIISIFGANLAENIRGAIRLPLPLALYHVSVSFDQPDAGVSVPGRLFFVSPGQLNVQVPWELAGLTFAMVKVRINDSVSAVYRLELSDYAPGIFEYDLSGQKFGVVTHADGSVVTPSNPARRGETVIVYATGVGPVDPPQASGEAASAQPLARMVQTPVVTVGGQAASVFFSGLAPSFVGLNQLNVTIPLGAPSGVQPLVITANGIPSNTVNVPVQ
ncbi:MAG: S8 family serine peptidase [Acidobacteria bacterium]|nr:S8 family serine peptidase [Acidobacteriota bacterium]